MGLILDTGVFIRMERGLKVDFSVWADYGEAFISTVTVSELLVGVHRANNATRRARRLAYVEGVLSRVAALPFTTEVARVHAELMASLMQSGQVSGAHDLLIAATAVYHGCAVLTADAGDFDRMPGLQVLILSSVE